MTTTQSSVRWWSVATQIVAVIVMLAVGFVVSTLAMLTTPENFTDAPQLELSDLGVLRYLVAWLLLMLIPWYRKIPLVLIIAGAFYAVIIQGDPYVLAIGLTVWIVRATQRWHWVVAGIGLASLVINIAWHILALLRMADEQTMVAAIVAVLTIGFVVIGCVLGISLITRQRRQMQQADDAVEAVAHDRDSISTQMTRQTEREYLAREVHDTLAQRLTALSLQTGQIRKRLSDGNNTELTDALDTTKQYSDQALKDLRKLVSTLREHGEQEARVPSVAPGGFDDLKTLFDDAVAQGLTLYPQIMLNSYNAAPDDLQRATLRISQEALTNVMRHSPDQTAYVRLEGQPGQGLLLEVTNRRDTARAFHGGSGTGLLGIQERAALLGGTAEVAEVNEHFRLSVTLPWPAEAMTDH